jgi:hypothetical protein
VANPNEEILLETATVNCFIFIISFYKYSERRLGEG